MNETSARHGIVTRLSIGCQWQTEEGLEQRYFSLSLLRQHLPWERISALLDELVAVCREVQESRDEHQPPQRRSRLP